jgi:hypothetical protein
MDNIRTCLYLLTLGLTGTAACGLEQEIELELPAYENRLVVECYLEPEKPYRLLLSRSAGYFDPFPAFGGDFLDELFVDNARVTITHRGESIELINNPLLDRETGKVYNYRSPANVPLDYEAPFSLEIITEAGDTLRASTTLLPPVPIDSVVVEFQAADTLARVLTYLTDPPDTDNYYRRVLHKGSLTEEPEQDFASDDRIVEDILVYGTGFDYAEGDTLINTIYHIEEPYYRFLETLNRAVNSNGNPFAQPSPLLSNISGTTDAIGIFTGLTYDRRETVIAR